MRKFLLITGLILVTMTSYFSLRGYEPDFSYPRDVLARADSLIKAAKSLPAEEAGAQRLAALELIARASRSIDSDSAFTLPERIAKMADAEPSAAARAMMHMLEAQVLCNIYTEDRWKYDRIEIPATPLPADISAWSGEQFKAQIDSLVRLAVNEAKAVPEAPIAPFAEALDGNKESARLTPTVLLMAFNRGGDILMRANMPEKAYGLFKEGLEYAEVPSEAYFDLKIKVAEDNENQWNILEVLYGKYAGAESARLVLVALANEWQLPEKPDAEAKARYFNKIDLIKESLEKFPDWYNNAELRNNLARMTRPSVSIEANNLVSPGTEVKIAVVQNFTTKPEIRVYRRPLNETERVKTAGLKPWKTISLTATGKDDFAVGDTLTLLLDQPGRYLLRPSTGEPKESEGRDYTEVRVVDWIPVKLTGTDNPMMAVVNSTTGAPEAGVAVWGGGYRLKSLHSLGTTDTRGLADLALRAGNGFNSVRLKRGDRIIDFDYLYMFRPEADKPLTSANYSAKIFTSRALYHLGDSIEWAAVVTLADRGALSSTPTKLAVRHDVTVTLYDANHKKVESGTFTTDEYGRVHGCFTARKDGLTGRYTISVEGARGGWYGTQPVTVSDFKLPTFEVKIDKVERDTPAKGEVTLSGTATTYAGMPVGEAQVRVNLLACSPWWRYFFGQDPKDLGSLETRTDARGAFTLTIPAATLAEAKDHFMVQATAIVTAPGGETQQAMRNFTLGKPYALSADVPAYADAADPVKITFNASTANPDEKAPAIALRWRLTAAADTVKTLLEGKAKAGETLMMKAGKLMGGHYKVFVAPEDPALAETAESVQFTLYNTKTGAMPEGCVLFAPVTTVRTDAEGRAEVLVGVENDDTYVYIATCQGERTSAIEMRKLKRGFHRIPVEASTERDCMSRTTVFTVRDCRTYRGDISLELPPAKTVRLTGSALRDKTTPGAPETWTLRFEDTTGAPVSGAAIATMYNRALSSLQGLSWPGGFPHDVRHAMLEVGSPSAGPESAGAYGYIHDLKTNPAELFGFRYVDEYGFSGRYIVHNMMLKRSMAAPTPMAEECEYDAAASLDVTEGTNDLNLPLGAMAAGVGAEEESAEAKAETNPTTEYRVAELLQAFWMPELRTGADGAVELKFTAPDAIGAWTLQAFAWNKELESGSLTHNAVSAKPVMVQPTLPRFLRQGDEAILTATLYNNTEDTCAISAKIVVRSLDGLTETATQTFAPVRIAAGESATVRMPVTAPTTASALSYTVEASGAGFTDGERGIIPVLESASTVIESDNFYLQPTATEPFGLTADNRTDFTYTLQYCQNPLWNVVKAMRGNSTVQTTSPEIASAIFSNLAAIRIIAENPAVAEAIRQWKANPSEEALRSMLEKNEQLKALVLDETPWVQMAENETARMTALADFLDKEEAEARVDRLFKKLMELRVEGAFMWSDTYPKPSYWATETVLTTFGIARSMGITEGYDKLIDNLAKPGLEWMDRSKYVRESKGEDLMFTYLRALYLPVYRTTVPEAKALAERTISYINKERAKIGTVEKAYAAIILRAYGREAEGRAMVRSLSQFGVTTPDKGMTFPSVDDIRGYATIIEAFRDYGEPQETLDAMRQWIILRTQATDDIGAYNPDYVIAAVMMSGSVWTDVAVSNSVTLNGKPLEIDRQESSTGYFCQELPAVEGKKISISVRPNGVTPSYGSLTRIGKLPAAEIKARGSKELAVTKRMMVKRDGEWTDATKTSIKVGERVRVDLEIRAGQDMEYVTVTDERPAGMEPVEQLPGWMWDGGVGFYRENRDASTNLFIDWMPKGTYHLSYEQTAGTAGRMISGICTIQSQLAPELTAHSAGTRLTVE